MSGYTTPKIWGPHFWFVMRTVAYNYPDNPSVADKNHVRTFFTNMEHILPCENCSQGYSQNLSKHPLENALVNRSTLMAWVETIYKETENKISQKSPPAVATTTTRSPHSIRPQGEVFKKTYYPPISKKPRAAVVAPAKEVNKKVFNVTKRCNCGH